MSPFPIIGSDLCCEFSLCFHQVIYASNMNHQLRFDRLSLWLGSWHIYKNAAERVFTVFLSPFLAGALHAIAPGNKIFTSPRLVEILGLFLRLRFAYPSFKSLLQTCLESDRVSDEGKSVVLNLKDLMEFFIPVVSFVIK
jgi:hypothetical protein